MSNFHPNVLASNNIMVGLDRSTQKTAFVSIVIPVYAESPHLNKLFLIIHSLLSPLGIFYELILIDDGSPDDTWNVIKRLSADHSRIVRGIRLSRNFGKESALCAGLDAAAGEAVILMDGDLQHPPELIPEMVHIWLNSDVDIVESVKEFRGNEKFFSKVSAGIFYEIFNRLSGYDLKNESDYKLLDRKVVDAWRAMPERNLFFRGMTAWLGFKRARIPFKVAPRAGGKSGWSKLKLIKLALDGITAFSSLPLHLITFAGWFFFLASILLGIQTLFLKLSGQAVSGFTTVILLLLIIGSLIMMSLGVIGLYLARIYDEVKLRPRYVISELTHGGSEKP